MNVLTSVLPGLRDFRTPLTVGSLWVAIVGLLVLWHPQLIQGTRATAALEQFTGHVPSAYAWAAAAVGIYLLGCVALPMQSYVLHRAGQRARRAARASFKRAWATYKQGRPSIPQRVLSRLQSTFSEDLGTARGLLHNAVTSALTRGGAPELLVYSFPVDGLLDRLDVAALQLGQTAAEHAQEYDRLRAEAEFRTGVAPPLAILLVLFFWYAWGFWAVLLGTPLLLLPSLILLGQAHRQRRTRQVLAARCVNLGYIRIPVLEDLAKELQRAELPVDKSLGSWAGVTAAALKRLGEPELAIHLVYGYFNQAPQSLEGDDEDMRQELEHRDASLLKAFIQYRDEYRRAPEPPAACGH